jgi:hypothetical protein
LVNIEHTMGYDEVAQTWRAIVHDDRHLTHQTAAIAVLKPGWVGGRGFFGATAAEMTDWVDHGRLVPGMAIKATSEAARRMKIRWNDFDGELDVERMLEGDDRPFALRERRKRQAGLALRLQYNFLGSVPAEVLADYAQWTAELIAGLQGQACDLQIDVYSTVSMLFSGRPGRVTTNIRVKRFGKRSSLKSWGALFSPSGYRMLGFTARMMACSAHKLPCSTNMGASVAPGWGITLDEKTRTLTVTTSPSGSVFPRELMDAKLAALRI